MIFISHHKFTGDLPSISTIMSRRAALVCPYVYDYCYGEYMGTEFGQVYFRINGKEMARKDVIDGWIGSIILLEIL